MQILTFSYSYLPGFRCGGPIRTLANMMDRLGDELCFKIITRDRDLKDISPYPGIKVDSWNCVGQAKVFYLSPQNCSLRALRNIIRATPHDVVYLNSFFSPGFTINPLLLRRLGLTPNVPIILAPRGEFSPGALRLKGFKKRIYLALTKISGLYRDIYWQASSIYEERDIRRWFGNHVPVIIAPDLPPQVCWTEEKTCRNEKVAGYLKILFLSRISRMKNLDGALSMLKVLSGKIQFNIYGPVEDPIYWKECQKIIKMLPTNIDVRYQGVTEHDQVINIMMEHDLFFFPTLGENFGHVILEALAAGCPVLISDQTPWRDLEAKGAGWDLPLSKQELFKEVLYRCLAMDTDKYAEFSSQARRYALQVIKNDKVIEQNKQLFYEVDRTGNIGKVS